MEVVEPTSYTLKLSKHALHLPKCTMKRPKYKTIDQYAYLHNGHNFKCMYKCTSCDKVYPLHLRGHRSIHKKVNLCTDSINTFSNNNDASIQQHQIHVIVALFDLNLPASIDDHDHV